MSERALISEFVVTLSQIREGVEHLARLYADTGGEEGPNSEAIREFGQIFASLSGDYLRSWGERAKDQLSGDESMPEPLIGFVLPPRNG